MTQGNSPSAHSASLSSKQRRFMQRLGQLITWCYSNGYELTGGELLRTQAQAIRNAADGIGITNSQHILKLAIDLNLFKDGVYLKDWKDYEPLGTYWKSLDNDCRWGGDFKSRDADHFSIEHNGVQ